MRTVQGDTAVPLCSWFISDLQQINDTVSPGTTDGAFPKTCGFDSQINLLKKRQFSCRRKTYEVQVDR